MIHAEELGLSPICGTFWGDSVTDTDNSFLTVLGGGWKRLRVCLRIMKQEIILKGGALFKSCCNVKRCQNKLLLTFSVSLNRLHACPCDCFTKEQSKGNLLAGRSPLKDVHSHSFNHSPLAGFLLCWEMSGEMSQKIIDIKHVEPNNGSRER